MFDSILEHESIGDELHWCLRGSVVATTVQKCRLCFWIE